MYHLTDINQHSLWAENAPAAILTTQAPAVGLQENRAVLTLDQAIQLAQQYQPLQTLWQSRLEIAEGNLKQSSLWQNPEISFEQTGFKSTVEQERSFAVSQNWICLVFVLLRKSWQLLL